VTAANFDPCFAWLLGEEGGYVDHRRDNGGATALGFTLASAKEAGLDVDHDGDVDKADLKKLRPQHVKGPYRARYWTACHCDELPAGLDLMVFDAAVNSGPTRARKWLQRAAGVNEDGIVGPQTLAAVKRLPPLVLINRIAVFREVLYRGHEDWDVFGKGWMRRLAECSRKSRAMASPGL
jgi:lysozyme family protein